VAIYKSSSHSILQYRDWRESMGWRFSFQSLKS